MTTTSPDTDKYSLFSREQLIACLLVQEQASTRHFDSWMKEQATHHANIEVISQHLLEEANARDWCADYDDFVERVNAHLVGVELTARTRLYVVTQIITIRRNMMVSAKDSDQAEEMASDEGEFDPYEFATGDWEIDDTTSDYEVREH